MREIENGRIGIINFEVGRWCMERRRFSPKKKEGIVIPANYQHLLLFVQLN